MLLYGEGSEVARNTAGNFYSYTVPADTLVNNGDAIVVEFAFVTNGAGATTNYSLIWGGTTIIAADGFTSNSDTGIIRAVIVRTGATSQRLVATLSGAKVSAVWANNNFAVGSATLSSTVTITAGLTAITGNQGIGSNFTVTLFQV